MQTSFDALINQFYRIVLLESNATNSDVTRTNNTQSLAGANRDVIQIMGFTICIVFWLGRSHMYCPETIVFGRLLMMDCPKHSLDHCLMGLSVWTNPDLRLL